MLVIHFLMTNAEWNVKIEFLKRNIFDSAKYQSNVSIRSIPQLFKHFIVTQQPNTQNKRKKKRNFNCMPSIALIFFGYKWAHYKIVNVKIQRQRKFCRRSDVVVLLFESFPSEKWWKKPVKWSVLTLLKSRLSKGKTRCEFLFCLCCCACISCYHRNVRFRCDSSLVHYSNVLCSILLVTVSHHTFEHCNQR